MPPWKPLEGFGGPFAGERRLTPQQIETIARWVETDMPEGRPQGRPSSPAAGAEWRLGPPDLIVTIPEPYVLAGDGPDVFRNFVIPVPIREQKYVAAIEFTSPLRARTLVGPGNASRAGSPHRADQLPLYARKELKPAWRTRAEVEAHLERRERP